MHFRVRYLYATTGTLLILWTDFAIGLRKRVPRATAVTYLEYQAPYLRRLAPAIRLANVNATNEFRVGWDGDIEADFQRERDERLAGQAERQREREQNAADLANINVQIAALEQQIGQEGENDDEELERLRGERGILETIGEPEDPPPAMGPSLTQLLDDIDVTLTAIRRKLRGVNYNNVPFQGVVSTSIETPPQEQRVASGDFNYRLLNREARDRTVDAVQTLMDLAVTGADGWDITINEDFAVEQYHAREEGAVIAHTLLSMLERFILEINNSWVFPHNIQSIFAYIYSVEDYHARRGREQEDDYLMVLIDWDGALKYSNNIEQLSSGVAGFMSSWQQVVRTAFKFLPRSDPLVAQALGQSDSILKFLKFYHNLLGIFYQSTKAMADRPFSGKGVDQLHFTMVKNRNERDALEELARRNQQAALEIQNQLNRQNQGNQVNPANLTGQLGDIARNQQ